MCNIHYYNPEIHSRFFGVTKDGKTIDIIEYELDEDLVGVYYD